ncbi:Uncharacterised protein [Mycobacteroides abscessus subsp. abscessus]|nr:Uncharacterised protein [Mycobacteroides abscessus subsp. abscessus]
MVKKKEHIIINDPEKLEKFHEENRNEIWVGYNNNHYDQYIHKAILCGFDPKRVNDYIIEKGNPGWKFSSLFRKIKMINYDVMKFGDGGLKTLEGYMGNDIRESTVPFDIDRKLTEEEIEETIKYCRHDVQQTVEVFLERKSEFEASRQLIKIFDLPITSFSKTKAQLVSEILGGMKKKFNENEFDFPIVTAVEKYLKKYRYVLDWYRNPENMKYKDGTKLHQLETTVAGVPHVFGWGGLHGAKEKSTEQGWLLNIDVEAYYPSTQMEYNFGYRNMGKPENFEKIHMQNINLKKEGRKVERLPFKIADNSISGQLKDKNSKLYDPLMNNAVCVNGQLMLLLLIEMVEEHVELLQSNTDGILVKLRNYDDYELIDDIVHQWEQMTGMVMEFEEFERLFQKDVNNYILVDAEGNVKTKGGYVKKLSRIDYNLPIINKALIEYMVNDTPVEKTINECDDLIEFQLVAKISGKYSHLLHGEKELNERCVRIFASNRKTDGGLRKVHKITKTAAKFPNSPLSCFTFNDNMDGVKTPSYLDRKFYIDMTNKRLRDFGVI